MIETLVAIEHIKDFDEQGFFSKSYLAHDKRLKRKVAVKDIHEEGVHSKACVEEYFEEAEKLSLASHPRVLPVYFVGLNHINGEGGIGSPRIVTKFMQNGSLLGHLEELREEGRTIYLDTGIRIAHDVIQGMIHLHSLEIMHLDVKAANILIGDDYKMVLADFGQAKMLKEEGLVELGDVYPSILTPEGVKKKVGGAMTDIYQFGVLLWSIFRFDEYRKLIEDDYNLETKRLNHIFNEGGKDDAEVLAKFKEDMKRLRADIKAGNFPPRLGYPMFVPKKLVEIINKCLSINPEDRYGTFHEIQSDLNELVLTNKAEDVHMKLGDNTVYFWKDDKECSISVDDSDGRFSLEVRKNKQRKNSFKKEDITEAQARRHVLKVINEL